MATMAMAGQGTIFGMGGMNLASQARAARNRELFELQKRARRGPTPEVFFVKHIDNSRIVKADDPERRREMRIFTMTMSILFLLVMIYVWQQFPPSRSATRWRRRSSRWRRCRSRTGNCG